MNWYGLVGFMVAALAAVPGYGGTGAGNEYKHIVNQDFDFHVAIPPQWSCAGCDDPELEQGSRETEQVWRLAAPENTTWLAAGFIAGFPAESMPELLSEIQRRHPDIDWIQIDRGDFIGYTSARQGGGANQALEYYLVDKHQVIRIEWQKDGAYPQRARQLDNIKGSIDRASSPLRVLQIRTERQVPYQVGEQACLFIEVDDLRAEFTDDSLKIVEVDGAPKHWSFKSIKWIGENNWFKVCYRVTTAFGAEGLTVNQLDIASGDQSLSCEKEAGRLECPDDQGGYYAVPTHIAPVINPAPDREGPVFTDLTYNASTQTVSVSAHDPSGLAVGRIAFIDSQPLYPDELSGQKPINVRNILRGGWNTIKQVIVYDGNGFGTILQVPEGADRNKRRGTVSTDYYELIKADGKRSMSTIPIVTFLQVRGAHQ